jgi:hypothetical protein
MLAAQHRPEAEPRPFVGARLPANVGGSVGHAARRPPRSPASRLLQGQCPPGNVGIGPRSASSQHVGRARPLMGPGPHQVTVLTVLHRYRPRPAAMDHVGRATPTASRAWTHCRSALARERWWVRQTRVATAIAFASKPAPTGIMSARQRGYWVRPAAIDHVGPGNADLKPSLDPL